MGIQHCCHEEVCPMHARINHLDRVGRVGKGICYNCIISNAILHVLDAFGLNTRKMLNLPLIGTFGRKCKSIVGNCLIGIASPD